MLNTTNPPVVAVREAVATAFSDTWLFQHGAASREAAAYSCERARELLARVYIDDPTVRARLDTILSGCEHALSKIRE